MHAVYSVTAFYTFYGKKSYVCSQSVMLRKAEENYFGKSVLYPEVYEYMYVCVCVYICLYVYTYTHVWT
jgi:hypothetical protein